MRIVSNSIAEGQKIPGEYCFCVPAAEGHVSLGGNCNPHLAWSGAPAGTKSFAIIVHDPDVPSRGDDVNQEGRSVPASLPRVDFFHWVLVDLPASVTEIGAGHFSSGITVRGKPGPGGPLFTRQGTNDYTGWFAGDDEMAGQYFGYDGPCPPWNDEIRHRYVFTVFALDVERLPLEGVFNGHQVREAIAGHVLDQASFTAVYTLNPPVKL
ncbi:MAG: YbhB/YbcL family Raf kinase inhibitor-like protein [Zoogloea sp.]|nr:YbhB/YbcL family Raf kinase inhibitor-like protein [Zoogloea sp.]